MTKILINSGPSRRGWHRLELFLRCPQLWIYRYIIQAPYLVNAERMPLVRGSLGHVGLAHHYARMRAAQRGENPDSYYDVEEAMELVAPTFGDMGPDILPVARGAVRFYCQKYATEQVKVLDVEREVEAQVRWNGRGPYLFTQRIDLAYEGADGRVWIEDHKFVAQMRAKVPKRYTLSGQFQGLQWFGRAIYGERFGGVRVNIIQVPNKDPVFGTDARVERIRLEPAPAMLERFPQLVCDAEEGIARLTEEIESGRRSPYQAPAAAQEQVCQGPYGLCDAFEACRWGDAA